MGLPSRAMAERDGAVHTIEITYYVSMNDSFSSAKVQKK